MNDFSKKANIALSLLNILVPKLPPERITKETLTDAYNYFYENIKLSEYPDNSVVIVDDIPRK